MALEATLAELEERRSAFRHFRSQVDEDLRRLRIERLAAEQQAIDHLVFKAAAEGASLGAIKRAYGTKDHRTISDLVRDHSAEIEAIKKAAVDAVSNLPGWLNILDATNFVVNLDTNSADYQAVEIEGGILLFTSDNSLWNEDFTIKNEAVELLDGKTENDSEEARIVGKFLRQLAR